MKKIFKYTLESHSQVISIPCSKVLCAKEQFNKLVVYAIVDTAEPETKFELIVIPTGHDIAYDLDGYTYIDTVKLDKGYLMYHVFYRRIDE